MDVRGGSGDRVAQVETTASKQVSAIGFIRCPLAGYSSQPWLFFIYSSKLDLDYSRNPNFKGQL